MIEQVESEVRSIRRQYEALKSPITDFEILDPQSEPRGLRLGGLKTLVFPHEGILDRILQFAMSVWHFKEYLKAAGNASHKQVIEGFADKSTELKIVADLANEKKHAQLDRPRSGLSPTLATLHGETMMVGVVRFDTSRSGMFEFAYNGRNRTHRFWVTNPAPIAFGTEIIVTTAHGPASKGDAVVFIHSAFEQWRTLLPCLGIEIRRESTE